MALKIINKSFDALFGKTTSIFLTTSVRKLLFDGIPINCNVTEFAAKAVCAELRKRDAFQKLDEDVLGFSFFGLVSITFNKLSDLKKRSTDRWLVHRGVEGSHRVVGPNKKKKFRA